MNSTDRGDRREGPTQRVAVLGGGITGLCAAYELLERAKRERRRLDVVVLEAGLRIGGKIVTETRDGAVIEGGPDSFLAAKPHAVELAKELGLGGDLIPTNPSPRTIFIYTGGKLQPLPEGTGLVPTKLLPFLTSKLLSPGGRVRALLEPLVPPLDGEEDESIASFARRRVGEEAADLILNPMLAGIYAGDAEQLSILSTFPQLRDMERKGGLLRGLWGRGAKTGDPAAFLTLKGGLQKLVEALALKLPPGTVKTSQPVQSIKRKGGKWQLQTPGGLIEADGVISTLAANVLAPLVADLDLELSCVLSEIPFVSTATVSFIFEKKDFPHPLDGFGFLIPPREGKATSAATFTSTKFPSRAPEGHVFIRSFVGGAGRGQFAEADDAQIARTARGELKDILGIPEKTHPKMSRVFKWTKANPQYMVGHSLRLRRIESCLQAHRGFLVAGASYHGVGLPDCIKSGREAAQRAIRALNRSGSGAAAAAA